MTLHFRDPVRAAQLRSVTEIASKAPLSCVKRNPIRYDFSGSAKLSSIVSLLSIILTLIIWSHLCYGVKFTNQSEVPWVIILLISDHYFGWVSIRLCCRPYARLTLDLAPKAWLAVHAFQTLNLSNLQDLTLLKVAKVKIHHDFLLCEMIKTNCALWKCCSREFIWMVTL